MQRKLEKFKPPRTNRNRHIEKRQYSVTSFSMNSSVCTLLEKEICETHKSHYIVRYGRKEKRIYHGQISQIRNKSEREKKKRRKQQLNEQHIPFSIIF